MLVAGVTVTVGTAFTETVMAPVFTQPDSLVPVIVYVFVVVGFATGATHAVQDSPVEGDHVYVSAPVAVSATEEPRHIVLLAPALTTGNVETGTVPYAVFE